MLISFALLYFLAYGVDGSHFRGSYITYVVNKTDPSYYPANHYATVAKIHVKFGTSWRRSDGQSYCTDTSIETCQLFNHGSWSIYYGFSELSQPYYHSWITASFYCERYSPFSDFTVGYNRLTVYLPKAYVYRAVTSSCCWVGGLQAYSSSSWHVQLVISMKQRPYPNYGINSPPQIDYIPVIQHHAYSYYYNYFDPMKNYALPVSDPDNDLIQCRWASNFSEGGGVWNSRIGTLHQNCSLSLSTYIYSYTPGWYPLAVMVEDFVYSYASGNVRMSSVPLQFTVYIFRYSSVAIVGNKTTNCTATTSLSIAPNPVYSAPASSMNFAPASSSFFPMMSSVAPTMSPAVSASQASDGCKYYQVLSDRDRVFTYNDWSSYRCDKELFGWYRFMGAAGNRMLDHCPNRYSPYTYKCGSYYQGWILSGSMPSVYQGVVSRTVCFSPYYSCICSAMKSILIKNCGSFHVYWMDSTSCNMRYCGKKDNSSVITCSQNYMRIDLDRRYYDSSLYSSITLKSSSCTASYSTPYITLGTAPGGCGGTRKDTVNHIVYENVVIMKAKAIAGVITRDMEQMVIFKCLYARNGFVSSLGYKPISSVNVTEQGFGNFTFNFWMYTDRNYRTLHTIYPVSVQLRDQLYFEVQASVVDSNVIVLIDRCYSTPTMDRNHFYSYTFIQNGCAVDNTVTFHATVNYKQRFSLQAFKFLQNSTAVYFHCVVYLCHKSSSNSRCRNGCYGNNIYRGKRSLAEEKNDPSKDYLLELGIKLGSPNDKSSKNKSSDKKYLTAVGVGVACFFVMAVAMAGLAIKVRKLHMAAKVAPSSQRENRYAKGGEKFSPDDGHCTTAYKEADTNMGEMQGIGIIDESMQKELFNDWKA